MRLLIYLRQASRCGLIMLHIGLGVFLVLGIEFVCWLLPIQRRRLVVALGRFWLRVASHLLQVKSVLHGQPQHGAVLVAANHISWLDILILGAIYGPGFVAKAEVARWPLLGWLAKRTDTLFIYRGKNAGASTKHVIERMAWQLVRRQSVVIFPEGTTTDGASVTRFKPRLYQAALLTNTPIQTVALQYTVNTPPTAPEAAQVAFLGEESFLHNLWRLTAISEIVADVHCLPPQPAGQHDAKAHAAYSMQHIQAILECYGATPAINKQVALPYIASGVHSRNSPNSG